MLGTNRGHAWRLSAEGIARMRADETTTVRTGER
jgi:hypothetical protein